jgi:uncharacterized membrane-anchored protein YhcB (DUF1043 family)
MHVYGTRKRLKSKYNKSKTSFNKIVNEVFPYLSESPQSPHRNNISPVHSNRIKDAKGKSIEEKHFDKYAAFSVAGESSYMGASAMGNLLQVDEKVYAALSHLAGEELTTIADLNKYLGGYEQNWYGGLKDAGINKVQGHIAEYDIIERLRESSIDVKFPEHSNEPGLDFIANGIPYNPKNVGDMSSIYKHFREYPEISVITHDGVERLPGDVLSLDPSQGIGQLADLSIGDVEGRIVIDPDLSYDAIVSQTESATDAILGNVGGHIPLITLGLSSFRELKLLSKKDTDIANSFKNVGLDVLGTGGGVIAGGKIGGVIGTAIFPGAGTVIGVIIGGVAGGITGRLGSNKLKKRKMEQALKEYKSDRNIFIKEHKKQTAEFDKLFKDYIGNETGKLKEMGDRSRKKIDTLYTELLQHENESYILNDNAINTLYEEHKTRLLKDINLIRNELESLSIWMKYIYPTEEYLELKVKDNNINNYIASLDEYYQLLKTNADKFNQLEKTNLLFEILIECGYSIEDIHHRLQKLKNARTANANKFNSVIKNEKETLVKKRVHSYQKISKYIETTRKDLDKKLKPKISKIKKSQSELVKEMKRLGIIG